MSTEWRVLRVLPVNEIELQGDPDEAIFQRAQTADAIVVTFDEDFADTRMYPLGSRAGVIRLRVWPTTIELTEKALERLLDSVKDRNLVGSLVLVDDQHIRVRKEAQHG